MSILDLLKSHIVPTDTEKLANLREELQRAEIRRSNAYLEIGDAVTVGLPTDAPQAKYDAESKQVRNLTAAIEVVKKRIQSAVDQAKADGRARTQQAFDAALSELQAKAKAVEATLEALQRDTTALAEALSAATAAAMPLGDEALIYRLNSGAKKFKFYLLHAASALPGCQVPYREHLEPYADNFPKPGER